MTYLCKHQNFGHFKSITHELDVLYCSFFFYYSLLDIYLFLNLFYLLENLFINVKPVALNPGYTLESPGSEEF